jgi:hypothetical protein
MAELINTNDNYKDQLMQEFHKLKWGSPKYIEDVSQQKNIKEGCQEIRSYTIYVKDPKDKIIGVGTASSKPKAEQQSAYNSLITMGIIKETHDDDSDYYGEESESESNSDSEVEATPEPPKIQKKSKKQKSSESESDYFEE